MLLSTHVATLNQFSRSNMISHQIRSASAIPHIFRLIARTTPCSRRLSSSAGDANYDVVIVGGGIVGLATAQELIHRHGHLKLAVVEKEEELASHQTGHNSGVIHAGIYYKPGSLMARLCVEGMHATYEYCDKYEIPYKKVGKLVVATNDLEEKRLLDLHARSIENGVPDIQLIDQEGIRAVEPACTGVRALWSPHTGIVDWGEVARHYGKVFKQNGGQILTGFEVCEVKNNGETSVSVKAKDGRKVSCSNLLTCGGLQSDRLAGMTGCSLEPKVVPFRGEYLLLNPEKAKLIKGNIYPVPDPRFPFLGVHFTPRMNGEVWLGPNAVLALAREGYTWGTVSPRDLAEVLSYPGFYKLGWRYLGYGLDQIRGSLFIRHIVKELQKYVPEVTAADISRGPAGVRAQAMTNAGDLVGDFVFDVGEGDLASRVLHCRNAPSPGATSSLAIAKLVVDKMEVQFGL